MLTVTLNQRVIHICHHDDTYRHGICTVLPYAECCDAAIKES